MKNRNDAELYHSVLWNIDCTGIVRHEGLKTLDSLLQNVYNFLECFERSKSFLAFSFIRFMTDPLKKNCPLLVRRFFLRLRTAETLVTRTTD